jgi:hypothetical protein
MKPHNQFKRHLDAKVKVPRDYEFVSPWLMQTEDDVSDFQRFPIGIDLRVYSARPNQELLITPWRKPGLSLTTRFSLLVPDGGAVFRPVSLARWDDRGWFTWRNPSELKPRAQSAIPFEGLPGLPTLQKLIAEWDK